MTIRKGETWGSPCMPPSGVPVFATERSLGKHLRDVGSIPEAILKSGNLFTAVGLSDSGTSDVQLRVSLDVIRVIYTNGSLDEIVDFALGSIVIGDRFLLGELHVLSNSGYVGSKEVLPKAHPNDGRFDLLVVEKEMKLSQRLQAWRRITTTSHIPHPLISTQQLPSFEWALGGKNARSRRIRMAVDGEDVGPVTGARFEIIPDALTVYL